MMVVMPSRPSSTDMVVERPHSDGRPADLLAVRVFAVALVALLGGYMFLGRGFAHLGLPPIYVGEVVLALGLVATGLAVVRLRLRPARSWTVGLLLAFMVLGLVRTVPYLTPYGADALRDGVLWGYAAFALMIYLLADRVWVDRALRVYGWIVPIFALWLPISWQVWLVLSRDISNQTPGATIPLVYFKAGGMVVHSVGAVGFLILLTSAVVAVGTFLWRYLIAQSLVWTMFVSGTVSRGALVGAAGGVGMFLLFAFRTRNWLPVIAAAAALTIALTAPGLVGNILPPPATATAEPGPVGAEPEAPAASGGRPVTIEGFVDNATSILTESQDKNQEGTKVFRLAWWGTIVDYTVFGPYFWTGKGFGVNLADDDGFQPTLDHSLRAPHNSHITALARMGVPGFALWVLVQGAWAIGMLRSILTNRRIGDRLLAAAGAWIFVYWVAMMVVTSFDPYIEGPQGGIWFWTLFGLGLVVMRLPPRPEAPATIPLLGEAARRISLPGLGRIGLGRPRVPPQLPEK